MEAARCIGRNMQIHCTPIQQGVFIGFMKTLSPWNITGLLPMIPLVHMHRILLMPQCHIPEETEVGMKAKLH